MAGGSLATHAIAIFSAICCNFNVMAAIGKSIGMVNPYMRHTKTTFMASEYLKWIMYSPPALKNLYQPIVVDRVTYGSPVFLLSILYFIKGTAKVIAVPMMGMIILMIMATWILRPTSRYHMGM